MSALLNSHDLSVLYNSVVTKISLGVVFITTAFNNREIAVMVWILAAFIASFFHKGIRKSYGSFVSALLNKKIILLFSVLFIYVALSVYLLNRIYLWDTSLIGDFIWWFFGTGLVLFFNIAKAEEKGFFKKAVHNAFTVTFVVGFFVGIFSFRLWIELILILVLSFVAIMAGAAGADKRFKSVADVMSRVLGIAGTGLFFITLVQVVSDYKAYFTLNTLREFLFAPAMTLGFLPFIYALSVLMAYEMSFIMLGLDKHDSFSNLAKRKLIMKYALNIRGLRDFTKNNACKIRVSDGGDAILSLINEE